MDTEHLSGDERMDAGSERLKPQGMTSAPAQMQWLDLKWRLHREKSVADVMKTHFSGA